MKTSNELHRIIKDSIKFPAGILNPEQIINFRGFFPICNGTEDGSDDLSKLKVMIVGQDFGKVKDHANAVKGGEDVKKVSTWKQLLPVLEKLGIDKRECFFTNYLIGVRDATTNIGPSPGLWDEVYLEGCKNYFETQVEIINPELIIFLGKVAYYLSKGDKIKKELLLKPYLELIKNSNQQKAFFGLKKIPCFYLIHPSQRNLNIKKGYWSEENEIDIAKGIKAVLKNKKTYE